MLHFRHLAAAPALVLLMGGTAQAALTADQVWSSWKDGAAMVGLTISAATEANSDGVLTLNGITVAPAGKPGGLTISDLTLTEQDDGSVLIEPGDAIALDAGDGTAGAKATLGHDGLSLVASEGEGGALVYDFDAAKLSVDFTSSQPGMSFVEGQEAKPATAAGTVVFEGLEGSYSDTPGSNRAFGLDLTAALATMDMSSDDPNLPMKTTSTSKTKDMALEFGLTLPATIALASIQSSADFGKALQEGLAVTFHVEQGDSTGTATQENEMFPYSMTMSSKPGSADFSFDKDAFHLTSAGDGAELDMTTPSLPAPVKLTFGPIAADLLSPVMAADAAADYGLKLSLSQFTLNDEIWGMFDPQAALKREPFDLAIDVSGKTKIDWIAMAVADETGAQPPVPAPESLNITDISLKLAGAAAKAVGAFTFDNSMGMPMPLGTADVSVTGANQLIDGLIKTGLLSEDDAMGARMMMAAFMKPGADPDSLTSHIEAKEGMQIFVNGQQIQ